MEFGAIIETGFKPARRAKTGRPLRLIRNHAPGGEDGPSHVDRKTKMYRTRQAVRTLALLSVLLDLDVELIALLYRYR